MNRTLRSALAWLTLLAAVVALPSASQAQALTLAEAKQKGWVGEQSDGFLGVVDASGAPPEAHALVKQINTGRTDVYAGIAKREGISVVAVAARSGERLIGDARSGEWVWQNGGWRQR